MTLRFARETKCKPPARNSATMPNKPSDRGSVVYWERLAPEVIQPRVSLTVTGRSEGELSPSAAPVASTVEHASSAVILDLLEQSC